MKRLVKHKFWMSSKGNLFDKNEYCNVGFDRKGFIHLPLDEYPYTIISLPTIIDKEIIKSSTLNTFYLKKRIKDY